MGSSFGSYQIAKSGMYVNERGLFVTGHNIANANTLGFSRQQSIIKTSFYQGVDSNMQTGTGAAIEQTRQIRSIFLDNIYRNENQSLGYSEAKNKTYTEIQNILSEPMNDGLQSMMNNYWDSWQELSKDPSSLTVRALVRQRGQALTDYANNMGTQLKRLQTDLNAEIVSDVDEVNNITSQIADLNVEIPKYESSGDQANDLRDKRNLLLDRLTKLINVNVTEKQNGTVDVTIGDDYLVNREYTNTIKVEPQYDTNIGIYYKPEIAGSNVELPLTSGSIKGLLESSKEIVPQFRNNINSLIGTMANEVNTVQKSGMTIHTVPVAGTDFFVATDSTKPIGMNNISLNPNLSDLDNIISSVNGDKGDNTLAVEIANLRYKECIGPATDVQSLDGFYQGVVQDIGNKAQEVSTFTKSQTDLVDSADNQRKSLSNVSMDEELSRMLKYQFAYGGASKAFNAIDEMVNTVVTKMGLVGR